MPHNPSRLLRVEMMPSSDKEKAEAKAAWPFQALSHGDGESGSPMGVRDIAILVPARLLLSTIRNTEMKVLVLDVPGLDGAFVLSSDGATRPWSGVIH